MHLSKLALLLQALGGEGYNRLKDDIHQLEVKRLCQVCIQGVLL